MSKSNRSRSYLRSRRGLTSRLNEVGRGNGGGEPGRLAVEAGSVPRPSVDVLEPRQMLFSLTVTQDDVNPFTGIGVARAFFGYAIPVAFTSTQEVVTPATTVSEDFNDEIPNGGGGQLPNPQNIPAVVTLTDSNIRLSHNISPANNFQITASALTPDDRRITARLGAGQQFAFSPLDEGGTRIAVNNFQFQIGPGQGSTVGLNATNMVVELSFNGQVIASFTGAQLLARNQTNPNSGVGLFSFNAPAGFAGFDTITVRAVNGPNDPFTLDNIQQTVPAGRYAGQVGSRVGWGVEVALAGAPGTTVQFFDLYGRDMIQTIALGAGTGNLTLIDRNDDGIPDGNDGIGKIVLSNTDRTSGLTLFGGTITYQPGAPDPDVDFAENGFVFKRVENLNGYYDDWEGVGFGFDSDPVSHGVGGLPPGGNGSVIVGSPFVRSLTDYNPSGNPVENGSTVQFPIDSGYTRPEQGVFVTGGRAMGSIYIHGMLFGSSQVTGALDRFVVSTLYGSLTVKGDLGALVVANDAGIWQRDSNISNYSNSHEQFLTQQGPVTILHPERAPNVSSAGEAKTGGQLVVGRTVQSIAVGGRSLLDVTVQGDINDPVNKPARDIARYYEKEFNYANDPAQPEPEVVIFNTLLSTGMPAQTFATLGQPLLFGTDFMRNDALMAAEWVGSLSSGVRVSGTLSGRDQINTGDDQADVYAFASDGTTPITVQIDAGVSTPVWFRILDAEGRTVAAPEYRRGPGYQDFVRYQPTAPGIYYVVFTDPNADDAAAGILPYTASILGMAPVTLGEYRTGASSGLGSSSQTGQVLNNSITLLSGNAGSIRIGTGFVSAAGAESVSRDLVNTAQNEDDAANLRGGTFSVPGTLYNITAGSDIDGGGPTARVVVGGDFGSLLTGRSPVIGIAPNEGDINNFTLDVGGRIASILAGGGSGIDQDATDPLAPAATPGTTQILSGRKGGDGSIGMIRFGSHIAVDALTVQTSSNSTIGAFLVSQDIDFSDQARSGLYYGNQGANFALGSGSDVRFVDFPRIDLRASVDTTFPLVGGQVLELVDDGGGRVQISVANVPAGFTVGRVRALPVSSSAGVAVAQIDVSLAGAAVLVIEGIGNAALGDVISIGKVIVNGADAGSGIQIRGNIQVDIWKIETAAPIDFIDNQTAGGDLVAIDASGLTTLSIATGNLGRTQVPGWGPQLIGPFVGIGGTAGFKQTAFTLPAASTGLIELDWNNQLYRPVNRANLDSGQAYLDDTGSPMDPFLNGLVVRSGNLDAVNVGGQMGDVLVSAGNIRLVNANWDRVTGASGFDGIVGTIYATNLDTVDVGDGLAARTPGPLSTTGIFAVNDIRLVYNANSLHAIIASTITAANSIQAEPGINNGIETVQLTGEGGGFEDAFISASNLDEFYVGFNYGDDAITRGDILQILGTDVDMSRSELHSGTLGTLTLTNGAYDATFAVFTRNVGTFSAAEFRNSTLTGEQTEFRINGLNIGNDLATLTTINQQGDIKDLVLDVTGSVTNEISARSIDRSAIDVDNVLTTLRLTQDLRGSNVTVGRVPLVSIGRRSETSKITAAGFLERFTAVDSIVNTDISVIGPFGQIGVVTAANLISGSIAASGPIGTVESTAGDVRAKITTTTERGNVTLLKAARDLDVRTDISGTVEELVAGRHIGDRASPGVVVVRGNLKSATAGGQLYSDLRVGQAVTGGVKIGRVAALPGNNQLGSGSIFAFGRISQVTIDGDFDGNIVSYSGGIGLVVIKDGSFYPDRTITAYDGHIDGVSIQNGNLYGDIHADWILFEVDVLSDAAKDPAGVFGDIGINDQFNSSQPFDAFRNALPVGMTATPNVDGPSITAGWNIGRIFVNSGSMFETSVVAGRAIGFIDIGGSITNDAFTPVLGTVIAAGDSIYAIGARGDLRLAWILSGVVDLGSDLRPGGVGTAHDTSKSGWINDVYAAGNAYALVFSAGLDSGSDGVYNTGDDLVVPGVSFINYITTGGTRSAVSAFSDSVSQTLAGTSDVFLGGTQVALQDPTIDPGFAIPGSLPITGAGLAFSNNGGAETGTLYFAGPGQAYFDAAHSKVVLVNTDLNSALTVAMNAPGGGGRKTLTNFSIVTNDDASVGALFVDADLAGASLINVDAYAQAITVGNVSGTTKIKIGGDLGTLNAGDFRGGSLSAKQTAFVNLNDYGAANLFTRNEVKMDLLAIGFLTINGAARGAINIDRDITSYKVIGAMEGASLRAGASIGGFEAGSLSRSLVSAKDYFGEAKVGGAMFDSAIMAGADLGTDAEFGGSGLAKDTVSSGFLGNVTVNGDFLESDLVAGILRGQDGFFGTSDDSVAEGRSTIGNVTISGTQVGSNRGSESYRVTSTGTLGTVLIGGVTGVNKGNFQVGASVLPPLPFQVSDLSVRQESKVYTAVLQFNQPVDSSSLGSALVVSEVRNGGLTEIRLVNGVDYTLSYDSATNSALVTFSRAVTDRALPLQSDEPAPGLYRFTLVQSLARAQLSRTTIDGDRDGHAEPADDYSDDAFVGDAGDKITSETITIISGGNPVLTVDMYAAGDLSAALDDNRSPDGLPDANRTFTVRGSIGDHPDNDSNYFRFSGDVDAYKVVLQAGQILRLGRMTGPAQLALLGLYDQTGSSVNAAQALQLPEDPGLDTDATFEQNFLVKTTGTYYIVVGNPGTEFAEQGVVPNPDVEPQTVGDYAFTVNIFDDGNSGFSAPTDAGNGTNVVNAPPVSAFAGVDGVVGTADDVAQVQTGSFTFTRSNGADGVAGTADDTVSGFDASGTIASYRNADGTLASFVNSAIGPSAHAGVPIDVFADVDVYHLNNRLPIATGTKLKVTVKLVEFGSDLGSRSQLRLADVQRSLSTATDYRGNVQLAVFDTSASVTADDASLVFSPTDFSPNGGPANTVIASGANATYGYDANGDFYIEFLAPGRLGSSLGGTYAVYLQGAFNTDYQLVVEQSPVAPTPITQETQNILLETRGGTIDWLESGGRVSSLLPFQVNVLGFNGSLQNGQQAQDYILSTLKNNLQSIYDNAGISVRFSTNPKDFEFQEFSTVYLTSSADPVSLVFNTLSLNFETLATTTLSTQPYGFSEHSDPFNSDHNDEAAVFLPNFAVLGYTPSQSDVDLFTQSLTSAVGRRVGELLGLRITNNYQTGAQVTTYDIQAANGVNTPPGAGKGFSLVDGNRPLSDRSDTVTRTDFFLGRQNALSLLEKYLAGN